MAERDEGRRPSVLPALTPEEWARDTVLIHDVPQSEALALAALALNRAGPEGKPYFTRKHVDALRGLANGYRGYRSFYMSRGLRDPADRVHDVADLVEALVRPEPPPTTASPDALKQAARRLTDEVRSYLDHGGDSQRDEVEDALADVWRVLGEGEG